MNVSRQIVPPWQQMPGHPGICHLCKNVLLKFQVYTHLQLVLMFNVLSHE